VSTKPGQLQTAPYYRLYLDVIEKAASSFAVELTLVEVHDEAEIERAISTLSREPDSGLFAMPDSFNMVHRQTIIALMDRYRRPAMYYFPFFAREGGLISYGPDEADMFRQAAGYRILKGAKASDLPVQQPTKFELVIATSALVGVQPVLTQVPPKNFRSMTATFWPAATRRRASAGPDCPVPMTIAS
jgi:putative tryptophan/tyrosine transport system substrate-binding protein